MALFESIALGDLCYFGLHLGALLSPLLLLERYWVTNSQGLDALLGVKLWVHPRQLLPEIGRP